MVKSVVKNAWIGRRETNVERASCMHLIFLTVPDARTVALSFQKSLPSPFLGVGISVGCRSVDGVYRGESIDCPFRPDRCASSGMGTGRPNGHARTDARTRVLAFV